MKKFLSCDWGTSSFRLKLVDGSNLNIIAEERGDQGISKIYALWHQSGKSDPEDRVAFYLNVIGQYIKKIEIAMGDSLAGTPLILSGMASSSIGLKELPYRQLPFRLDGSDIGTEHLEASDSFNHPVLLISGVKSEDDVMRGEETQLLGTTMDPLAGGEDVYIFPGTHSKHITVKGKYAIAFKTYMTGELFNVLSENTILNAGIDKNSDLQRGGQFQSFKQGVHDARGANLLNISFRVRTNLLFDKLTKKENYNYLSGLLIGTELQDIKKSAKIYLCCGSKLKLRYETALRELDFDDNLHIFPAQWAEEAVVRGQLKILEARG